MLEKQGWHLEFASDICSSRAFYGGSVPIEPQASGKMPRCPARFISKGQATFPWSLGGGLRSGILIGKFGTMWLVIRLQGGTKAQKRSRNPESSLVKLPDTYFLYKLPQISRTNYMAPSWLRHVLQASQVTPAIQRLLTPVPAPCLFCLGGNYPSTNMLG